MDRRAFLTGFAGVAVLFVGCLDNDDGAGPPEDDRGDCPEGYGIFVSLRPDIPEDVAIIDAEDEGLLELEEFAEVLSDASDAYEDGMEDDIDEPKSLAEGMDMGELESELDNSDAYVQYNNTTFYVDTHVQLQC